MIRPFLNFRKGVESVGRRNCDSNSFLSCVLRGVTHSAQNAKTIIWREKRQKRKALAWKQVEAFFFLMSKLRRSALRSCSILRSLCIIWRRADLRKNGPKAIRPHGGSFSNQ